MKKILVTGGAGFIGSHLVDALIKEGHEVHVIDNLLFGRKENVNNKAILHVVDIRDKEKLTPIFVGASFVFHEAALPQVQYSIENPIETDEVNVIGTLNVLEASGINKVKRLIFASSSAVYGNQENLPIKEEAEIKPLSPYGAQKYIGEVYCKLYSQIYGLETVCLRYFNVYGKRQSADGAYASVIPKFLELRNSGKPLLITGDGEQKRDFINVADVVNANLKAMASDKVGKGESINIGSRESCSVNYIADLIGGEKKYIPPRIEPRETKADIKKAVDLLGWEPEVNFEEGVKVLQTTML